MDAHAGSLGHRLDEHLAGPGGPTPTMFFGIAAHDPIQFRQEMLREFLAAVVFAAIPECCLTVLLKALDHAIHRGVVDLEHLLNLTGTASIPDIENDEVTDAHSCLPAFLEALEKALLDDEAGLGENNSHGNSSSGPRGPWGCLGIPIFYSARLRKPLTCPVQLNRAR